MSHPKYPSLELKCPKFEYFLYHDFKVFYLRIPNPVGFSMQSIVSSVSTAHLGQKTKSLSQQLSSVGSDGGGCFSGSEILPGFTG